ncbi:MAG: site-specific integrase [Heyndrickxia oleronia]|uniref:tyrosine-type recombinase/integrase n=1 Tax=Heyndrickxia oleronia TaxID=38875 RepID=UPI00242BB722|nr:site-specific integrase [Heyndrickxia oleronia]MCI1590409.1 site-specific integrase [Heyndrickxia oleronia]MCI1742772.1 site-specific integrase [Heyndrickxia oleronia]
MIYFTHLSISKSRINEKEEIILSHVRKEGKSWYYAIDLGKDANGKRKIKKKRGFKTEREARKALLEVESQLSKGVFIEPSKILYEEFLHDWIKDKQISVKNSTLETYKGIVNGHIIPSLGKLKLSEITARHIQNLIRDLFLNKTLSDENIQKVYTIIKDSLNSAMKFDLLAQNVCNKVDRPKAQKKEMQVWDIEEVQKFLDTAINDRAYLVFHLALTTGMRQAEILGLRWKNVDLKNGIIYVKEQLERYTHNFTSVKTKSSNRNIAIPDKTIFELKKQRKLINEERLLSGENYTHYDLVCPTSVGTPYLPSNLTKIFRRIIKEAGVKKIRFHDMRHTHATLLLKQNTNPKIVAERLGHSNTRTTLDIYSHLLPNMQKDTAKMFGDMLFSVNSQTN